MGTLDVTTDEVLAEIRAYFQGSSLLEGDVTVAKVAEDNSCSRETARTYLNHMVEDGKLEKFYGVVNKHRATIYRKVQT